MTPDATADDRRIGEESLLEAINRHHAAGGDARPLGLRRLLARFVAVCQTLEDAHSRGVAHGRVALDRILVNVSGETRVVNGSPAESTRDGDILALGGVLFGVLTGERPTPPNGPARGPRDARPGVPKALDAVCRKALARDPAERYARPADLGADVERWLADEPVTAYAAPPAVRAARWIRKHPSTLYAFSATLVALSIGLTVVGATCVTLATVAKRETVAREKAEQARKRAEALADSRFRVAKDAVDTYLRAVTEDSELKERGLHNLRKRLLETAAPFNLRLAAEGGAVP